MPHIDFDQLWNFGQPSETEQKFKALIPELQNNFDALLQLQTQIARTQGLQRKFDEAHATLNEILPQLNEQTPGAHIRYNLERGRVFNSSLNKTEARPLFLAAYELALKYQQDNFAVDAAHMMAIVETDPELQIQWNLKALKLAETSANVRAQSWLGSLYNNIGWIYHSAHKYLEALDVFQKALALRESKGDAASIRIAKWCVARTYRSLNRLPEALDLQLNLEKEIESTLSKDGFVFEELGEIYLALAQSELAQKYFALAYSILSADEWFKANESKRLQRINDLSLSLKK